MMFLKTLFVFLAAFANTPAADYKTLNENDMKEFAKQVNETLSACKQLKALPTLETSNFKNQTSESIDKKKFSQVINDALKESPLAGKKADAKKPLKLWAALSSTAQTTKEGHYTGVYKLKYNVLDDKLFCGGEYEITKTGSPQ